MSDDERLNCGMCEWKGPISAKALRDHYAEAHPGDLAMLESENGPLDALIAVAPIFDAT